LRIVLSIATLVALSACGDPLDQVGKLSDLELPEGEPVREAVAASQELGLQDNGVFDGLFRRIDRQSGVDDVPLEVSQDAAVARLTVKERRDLLARLRRAAEISAAALEDPVATSVAQAIEPVAETQAVVEDEPRVASLDDTLIRTVAPRRKRTGPRIGPDAADVALGSVLPFGTVARVCEAKSALKGKPIETAGAGRGYAIHDSNPGSAAPRTFYVTGFSDGCPRQFTAALALFGAPEMHEQLRYGRPSDAYPYSTTDKAYEKVKASVCNVAQGKPCGSKINRLEDDTVFISTYEKFSTNGRWADLLLHKGTVVAAAIKGQ